jgi:tRNA dimethylallyltransferase
MPSLQDRVIIIVGPTASGKSALAESLAVAIGGEIINADVGQFYAPLSIGTAKPDLAHVPVPHHLFDICVDPVDVNVVQYRNLVLQKIREIKSRNKVPFLVGGSLFYIKSLFFTPQELPQRQNAEADVVTPRLSSSSDGEWGKLNEIDPVRAAQLHPNDLYRIQRALDIWQTTGVLPSQARPKVEKPFEPLFIWIDVDNETIKDRIGRRTDVMLQQGWIEETQEILTKDSRWEKFFDHKGLIGYREIADWIARRKNTDELADLTTKIINLTYWYAKRQKTFWRSFKEQMIAFDVVPERNILNSDTVDHEQLLNQIKEFLAGHTLR